MNIKIFINTLSVCMITLILSELSTSQMLTVTEMEHATHSEKESYYDSIKQFFAHFFYKKEPNQHKIETPLSIIKEQPNITQTDHNLVIINKAPSLPRHEALESIRTTTGKIFDPNDPIHISIHLEDLKKLTVHLDPTIDRKTITAIHFLIENQHRSSLLDTVFWIKNIKEKELDTSIPVTEQVFNMPKTDKLRILREKLATPILMTNPA